MIVLIGAVLAAVTVVAIPEKITAGINAGICRVTGDKNCDKPTGQGPRSQEAVPSGQPTSVPPGQETPQQREYREALEGLKKANQDAEALENEWNNFDLLKEIGKLGLDFLAGDIIKCVEKPNFSDCLWALVGIVPWGKIGKLLKSIPKIVKLIDRFLDLKRRLEKARDARKNARKRASTACTVPQPGNSFVAGTPVLMADGTRRPIERVRVGDAVLAADPATGRAGARTVTRLIAGQGHKHLVGLIIDLDGVPGGPNARVTATSGHPFWVNGAAAWIDADDLLPGDALSGTDGGRALVLAKHRRERVARVYNLTVADLHTYYVLAGGTPVLVHNSGNGCFSTRTEKASDLVDKYTEGQSTRDPASQWYHEELSNEELLDSINNAEEGDGILVSRDGQILGGHHRMDELLRRIRDGRIDPNTEVRIEVYGGE
ncbi:polymorphic toxin-type HINT domain-containing protein [Actinomadura namibiensis]|uniref:Hint domain-containing protein n=1 Tax=Actinomadura namibiensis TaxID=182080 RepID=A0A7W3LI13_ACTNM|nr:polymorphic toxin-type HINT domain-containing protein [Actinomadura namibiensis]MBA8948541.1 hypothetical protein [Actinomadura namibiensis]